MRKLLLAVFFALLAPCVFAADGVFVEYGMGNQVEMARLGAMWKWDGAWQVGSDWRISGLWEASLGRWIGFKPNDNNQTIYEVGITPVFRMERDEDVEGAKPYLEAGLIGMHLISPTFIYSGRKFGSAFQFGNHLGVGFLFGERRRFDLGIRYQHMSNATIKLPNQGVNFLQAHFVYRF